MTPHISAKKSEIAKFVLMPGDPLRAKKIAETYLEDVKLVNEIRGMLMYTGNYKGVEITVAGSGMGCPSIGIYSYELFNFYGVQSILRIGSAGAYRADLPLYSIYNVKQAYSESTYAKLATNIHDDTISAGEDLYNTIQTISKEKELKVWTGTAHSSDVFYRFDENFLSFAQKSNLDLVEMESFALFANAKYANKQAACLLTVSDNIATSEKTTADERQNNFMQMVELGLEAAVKTLTQK